MLCILQVEKLHGTMEILRKWFLLDRHQRGLEGNPFLEDRGESTGQKGATRRIHPTIDISSTQPCMSASSLPSLATLQLSGGSSGAPVAGFPLLNPIPLAPLSTNLGFSGFPPQAQPQSATFYTGFPSSSTTSAAITQSSADDTVFGSALKSTMSATAQAFTHGTSRPTSHGPPSTQFGVSSSSPQAMDSSPSLTSQFSCPLPTIFEEALPSTPGTLHVCCALLFVVVKSCSCVILFG